MPVAGLVLVSALAAAVSGPREQIEQLFRAFNRHDVVSLQALYSPDAQLTSSDFCRPRRGVDVTRTYQSIFAAFPDIRDDVKNILIDGEFAAVRFVSSSNTPGNPLHLKLMTFFRFKNGWIIEDDTVFDSGGRPCEE